MKNRLIKFLSVLGFIIGTISLLSACGEDVPVRDKSSLRSNDGNTQFASVDFESITGILVKFKGFVNSSDQQALLQKLGLKEVKTFSFIPGLSYVEFSASGSILDTLQTLRGLDEVSYAEPDFSLAFDSVSGETSLLTTTSAKNKLQGRTGEEGVTSESAVTKVAILDTGVNVSHNDLANSLWVNVNEIPLNNIDDDHNGWVDDIYGWNFADEHNNVLDDHDRGTHVAGIITGKINDLHIPLDNNIKLVSLKIYDDSGRGNLSFVLGALDYIVKNDIRISNHSWSIKYESFALKDAIQQLQNEGHLLVIAAGDAGSDIETSPVYPISYNFSNVLTVAALNDSGSSADFSNYSKNIVHLSAPGSDIVSWGASSSSVSLSGSSMASAFVTGVAARVLHAYKKFTAQDIKAWLLENALENVDLAEINITSSSLTDLSRLVQVLDPSALTETPITPTDNNVEESQVSDTEISDTEVSDTVTNPTETNEPAVIVEAAPILSAAELQVSIGNSIQLTTTAGTEPFNWTSSDITVGTIDETGLFQALTAGPVDVHLTDANGLMSNVVALNVTPMEIMPNNLGQLKLQQRITISALGGVAPYEWTISDSTVASITANASDTSEVELSPIKTGVISLSLTDSLGNTSSIENIDVNIPSLVVTPSFVNMAIGESRQLSAQGGASPYQYSSTNDGIVTVDLGGFVTSHAEGIATISVTDTDGQVSNVSINVNAKLSINTARRILSVNESLAVTINGGQGVISWASSDSSVISVDNTGLLTAHNPGMAAINVVDEVGVSGSVVFEARQIAITSAISSLTAGSPVLRLTASGGSAPYTWVSDNDQIIGISPDGWLTAITAGTAFISATDSDGFTVSTEFSVDPAPLSVNRSNLVLAVGNSSQLIAKGGAGNYSWVSSDDAVVSIDSAGLLNAVALGAADITITDSDGATLTVSVQVQEIGLSVVSTDVLITDPVTLMTVTGGTAPYSWTVSDENVASVDTSGWLTPLGLGLVTVTVTDVNSLSASISISVDVNPLAVTPNYLVMGIDQSQQFYALGGDNSYVWSSDDSSIVSITETGLAQALTAGSTSIVLTDGMGQSINAAVVVRDLVLTADSTSVAVGDAAIQLGVDGGVAPYTWNSDNSSVATISNAGVLVPVSAGNVRITVADTDGISTSLVISVIDPMLTVNTNDLMLAIGENFQLNAIGGDGNYAWTNSDPSIATVDNAGIVNAVAVGSSSIGLIDGTGESIVIYVEVRAVSIDAVSSTLMVGQTGVQLSASGGVGPYSWNSDNTAVLTVDQSGNLSALSAGLATVTVTDQDGFSGILSISVNNPLTIDQTNTTLVIGSSLTIIASEGSGTYTWSSSDSSIASVDSVGFVTALAQGSAVITATDSMGQTVTAVVDVIDFTLSANSSILLITDGSLQINVSGGVAPYVWSVNDSSIATIDSSGLLSPLTAGTVSVSVTDANNNVATLDISVDIASLTISANNALLSPADILQLTATGGDGNYTWTTSDDNVASVNASGGIVAVSAGTTTITVTDGLGTSLTADIEVRSINLSISSTDLILGSNAQVSASGGNGPYTWSSSNASIASVDSTGQVDAIAIGNTIITVTDADGFESTISINVMLPDLTISDNSEVIGIDDDVQLSASGGDGNFTWSSSDNSIASVNSSGRVTGNDVGTAIITVTDGFGTTRSTSIEVRDVTLSASTTSIFVGGNRLQVYATGGGGSYSWSSSNNSIAQVNDSGRVTAMSAGYVTITARDGRGFSGSINLRVYSGSSGGDGDDD